MVRWDVCGSKYRIRGVPSRVFNMTRIWVFILPNNISIGSHLEEPSPGPGTNEGIPVDQPVGSGNEVGEEGYLVRGRVLPCRLVRSERFSGLDEVMPIGIHRRLDFNNRRVAPFRSSGSVVEHHNVAATRIIPGNPTHIVLEKKLLMFHRAPPVDPGIPPAIKKVPSPACTSANVTGRFCCSGAVVNDPDFIKP
jgi:hypothetical protein